MSTVTLTGARWSSAVRCAAKAEHEALGTPKDDNAPPWLDNAFARGFHIGEAWAMIQATRLEASGKTVERELEVPWGPPEFSWRGHVDLADMTDRIVYEAYHSKDLDAREEKILQAAGYATMLGPDWRAVVVAINATDTDADGGFATRPIPVSVDGKRAEVLDIQARVVTAVALGEYNPDDRVSDTPKHPECQACPFLSVCHAGWTPPAPQEVVGLEDTFVQLRVTDGDRKATAANLLRIEKRRKELIETIEQYVQPGIPVTSGDVTIRRTHIAEGVSFSLTDALKAGHSLPVELEAFAKTRKGYDKWEVNP